MRERGLNSTLATPYNLGSTERLASGICDGTAHREARHMQWAWDAWAGAEVWCSYIPQPPLVMVALCRQLGFPWHFPKTSRVQRVHALLRGSQHTSHCPLG